MSRGQIAGAAVVVGLLSTVGIALQASQPTQQHEHQQSAQKPGSMGSGMMDQNRDKMMADMKAADTRLQELVAKMNSATGDQKVNVIADLLTQLVNDQVAMHQRMMQMGGGMMSHAPQK